VGVFFICVCFFLLLCVWSFCLFFFFFFVGGGDRQSDSPSDNQVLFPTPENLKKKWEMETRRAVYV